MLIALRHCMQAGVVEDENIQRMIGKDMHLPLFHAIGCSRLDPLEPKNATRTRSLFLVANEVLPGHVKCSLTWPTCAMEYMSTHPWEPIRKQVLR